MLDLTELIAHEFEHVLEQLDGVDLKALARAGEARRLADGAFETERAVTAVNSRGRGGEQRAGPRSKRGRVTLARASPRRRRAGGAALIGSRRSAEKPFTAECAEDAERGGLSRRARRSLR